MAIESEEKIKMDAQTEFVGDFRHTVLGHSMAGEVSGFMMG